MTPETGEIQFRLIPAKYSLSRLLGNKLENYWNCFLFFSGDNIFILVGDFTLVFYCEFFSSWFLLFLLNLLLFNYVIKLLYSTYKMDFCFLLLLPFFSELLSLTIKTLEGCDTTVVGETLSILIPMTPVLIFNLLFRIDELVAFWTSVEDGRLFSPYFDWEFFRLDAMSVFKMLVVLAASVLDLALLDRLESLSREMLLADALDFFSLDNSVLLIFLISLTEGEGAEPEP